jgi:hypothetical protein
MAFGSFYDTTEQTNDNVVNLMQFNRADVHVGVAVQNGSEITFGEAGVYNIQFSAQVVKTDAGNEDQIEIWLRLNGDNLPYTNTHLATPGNNSLVVAAWNFFVSVEAGDVVELAWYSADTAISLFATEAAGSPDRPAIPSVILTVNQIY